MSSLTFCMLWIICFIPFLGIFLFECVCKYIKFIKIKQPKIMERILYDKKPLTFKKYLKYNRYKRFYE